MGDKLSILKELKLRVFLDFRPIILKLTFGVNILLDKCQFVRYLGSSRIEELCPRFSISPKNQR